MRPVRNILFKLAVVLSLLVFLSTVVVGVIKDFGFRVSIFAGIGILLYAWYFGWILLCILPEIIPRIKHPKKAILPLLGLLFVLAIGYWFISNNISDRRSRAEKRVQVEAAIEDMVTKHAAITDWKQQLSSTTPFRFPKCSNV